MTFYENHGKLSCRKKNSHNYNGITVRKGGVIKIKSLEDQRTKKMPWLGSETLPLSLGGARDFNPYPVSQVIGQAQQHQAK